MKNAFRVAATTLSLGGAVVAGSVQGCAAITNTTAVQCTTEAECLNAGPAFAGTTCDKVTKTCIRPADNVGSCTTNQECLDQAGGKPAICRRSDSKCITLTSDECQNVLTKEGNAELADDDVVVIGAITPDQDTELGTVFQRAIELAHFEISNTQLRGLPPLPGKTKSRPLAVVACREFGKSREDVLRAADHLSNVVQVPLVIGPIDSANIAVSATQFFLPKKTLMVLPITLASQINSLPNPIAPTPLMWHLFYDDTAASDVVGELIKERLEPYWVGKGVTPVKLAIVVSDDLIGQSGTREYLKTVRFNGKSASENQADGNLRIFNIGDVVDTVNNPNPEAKIGQTIGGIFQFKPNIILYAFPPQPIPRILFPIEGGWPSGTPLPFHVSNSGIWNGFAPLFPFLAQGAQANSRPSRFFAVQQYTRPDGASAPFPVNSSQVQTWLERFFGHNNDEFRPSPAPRAQNVWPMYDSVYLSAFALAALGDKPVTGENLAGTLQRLVGPGTPINTFNGPDGDTLKAFNELGAGRNIDVQGLFGHLDFDLQTGRPRYGLEVTCPVFKDGIVSGFTGSGFHYRVDQSRAIITPSDGGADLAASAPLTACPLPPP